MEKEVSVAHIQHDFVDCIRDKYQGNEGTENDAFFINVDQSLDKVEEYRVKVLKEKDVFSIENGNTFEKLNSAVYQANLDNKKYKFQTIRHDHTIEKTSVNWTSVDVFQGQKTLYCLGDSNGNIAVYNAKYETVREIEDAHASDITSLKFFPSGEVLLSASTDMQLKLWSIMDGSSPRTFVGHKSKVTGTAMIERGRNFLSSSHDGTIRLWECGSGLNLHSFKRKENPNDGVNTIQLMSHVNNVHESESANDLEFGTTGKQILGGHVSGVITLHDVFSKRQVLQIPSAFMSSCSSLTINSSDNNYVYGGYENGALALWDLRNPLKPVDVAYINKGIPVNYTYYFNGSLYVSSGVDTSMKFETDPSTKFINTNSPTFLVSEDHEIAQYTGISSSNGVVAVGNWGFCAEYSN
ncbi:hypothetical protein KAFR_0F03340 [Kazachstania africana CBS 2517]|uniref:Uncharacterized protein n=1 Tax=Kazachstania africana (strain ATCC 22294 / BCRC 22015 / CBS 2517 / CECT 1963 / NBRC 1671 / NRRL Y-8276) TaxID=1071382 RepID=H2AX30_KAZAF|nr:hypothetical protein KAFR_0F03340 [Kazachstania africana CBS 2517]CCF58930.1 hypothetical protein KAFR_0F03340 [Kazachstania africana CBS 2517]